MITNHDSIMKDEMKHRQNLVKPAKSLVVCSIDSLLLVYMKKNICVIEYLGIFANILGDNLHIFSMILKESVFAKTVE